MYEHESPRLSTNMVKHIIINPLANIPTYLSVTPPDQDMAETSEGGWRHTSITTHQQYSTTSIDIQSKIVILQVRNHYKVLFSDNISKDKISLRETKSSVVSFNAADYLRLHEFWKCQHKGWWVHKSLFCENPAFSYKCKSVVFNPKKAVFVKVCLLNA